ncbi:MAG: uncharacterized protein QOC87_1004 [Actinomycetota bacterium]|nr:uncharacterized protein [Actinomycetota bacterium]
MTDDPIETRSTDGLLLEAVLDAPDEPKAVVVMCHPHPQMGGTMNAPLLLAVRDALVAEGWAVLRFNFRGIGASEGTSSTGRAEVADAAGAVRTARDRFDGFPVAIAGWSFGAAVAVRYTTEDRDLAACVAIAPAVRERPGITDGLPDPNDVNVDAPLLIVCGANDDLVEVEDCRAWAELVAGAEFIELRGANHFFWGKYDDLAATVSDFLDDVI